MRIISKESEQCTNSRDHLCKVEKRIRKDKQRQVETENVLGRLRESKDDAIFSE